MNEHGGTAAPSDWTLSAAGPTRISGTSGADEVTAADIEAGSYTLSETGGPDTYDVGDWDCEDTDGALPVNDSKVTAAPGADVTCTITNTDRPTQPSPSATSTPEPTPTPSEPQPSEPTATRPPGGGSLAETGGNSTGLWLALSAALLVAGGTLLATWRLRRR
ncbi:hypothetical protein V2W30_38570 [Streptomyces sp. Q6]|uniref:Uncharacterized protein n=1 Tax=Streptomyces citrinus TaxID=3118173 RepID=A0ACD5AQD7_9ACTN